MGTSESSAAPKATSADCHATAAATPRGVRPSVRSSAWCLPSSLAERASTATAVASANPAARPISA